MAAQPLDSQYNARVNDVMLSIARYIPVVMILYGLAVQLQLVAGSPLYTLFGFISIMILLVITGLTQPSDFGQSPVRQSIYIVLFLSFAMFVSGIQSILLFWPTLMVTTVLNFGKKSFWWSSLGLFSFVILDGVVRWADGGLNLLLSHLVLAAVTAVASGLVIAIVLALATDHRSLIALRRTDNLQFRRMQALVNSIDDAIISVDQRGTIQLYNAAVLSLLDTNKTLTGQKLDSVLHIHDQTNHKKQLFDIVTKNNRTVYLDDLWHYFGDGEKIRLNITATAIRASFGKTKALSQGYIFIIRDITKTKSLEEERDEFISVISHELRTPITITEASLSNMQLIAERAKADFQFIKGLGEAHDQVIFLSKMINDLSALARSERADEVSKEEIDVKRVLENLYNEYAPQVRDKQLILNLDIHDALGKITTNKLYFEEILQNFITNAMKYTAEGSITLRGERTKHGILVAVKDTGHGISKSDQAKVFDKFYRSEDYRTRETGGTGLG
ncbi:MAG: sensor histidine kinase, partial [Segetibacter sp.]